jgi:hypothetical protein
MERSSRVAMRVTSQWWHSEGERRRESHSHEESVVVTLGENAGGGEETEALELCWDRLGASSHPHLSCEHTAQSFLRPRALYNRDGEGGRVEGGGKPDGQSATLSEDEHLLAEDGGRGGG